LPWRKLTEHINAYVQKNNHFIFIIIDNSWPFLAIGAEPGGDKFNERRQSEVSWAVKYGGLHSMRYVGGAFQCGQDGVHVYVGYRFDYAVGGGSGTDIEYGQYGIGGEQ
jgi:hypothetical protein